MKLAGVGQDERLVTSRDAISLEACQRSYARGTTGQTMISRVFTEDHWGVLEQECAPFRMFSERLGILESNEERSSEILDCNYLVFTL